MLSLAKLSHTFRLVAAGSVLALCLPAAWGHGAIDERVMELTDDISKSPDDASLHFQLSDANCQHEDWVAAMKALARAEELAPGRFPVDLMRGRIHLGAKRPEQALDALARFLKEQPGNSMALIYRARALALVGRGEESLADYRAALAAATNPEPDHFQEAAEALALRGHAEEAVRVLAAGIAKLGPVPSLILKAMEMEIATGKFNDALLRVDVMRVSAPRPDPWMAKRAEILDKAGRSAEALAAWQALAAHIAALPNLQRGSHSMSTSPSRRSRRSAAFLPQIPTPAPLCHDPHFHPSPHCLRDTRGRGAPRAGQLPWRRLQPEFRHAARHDEQYDGRDVDG